MLFIDYKLQLKDIKYEEPSIFNDPDYLLLKDKFELNCFRLENPFSYVFISDDKDIQFFNNEKLRNWAMKDYSLKITDPNDDKIKKFFIYLWMSDPKQKTYKKNFI